MQKVRFGVAGENWGEFAKELEIVLLVEKLGFDGYFIPDQFLWLSPEYGCFDPFIFLAVASTRTKNIDLGTIVTCPHRRHPAVLAQTVATLDLLSNGRIILGIGAGEPLTLAPFGIPHDKPVSKLQEAVKLIKRLWVEPSIHYEGKFYKFQKAYLPSRKYLISKPHPSIWIAASLPRAEEVTAELADGWITVRLTPEIYKENLEKIKRIAKEKYGRTEEIVAVYTYSTALSENFDEARKLMEPERAQFLFGTYITERLGYKIPKGELVTGDMSRLIEYVPFEAVERTQPFGTVDSCIALIEKFIRAGVRYFLPYPVGSLTEKKKTLKIYAEKVIPYFKEQY